MARRRRYKLAVNDLCATWRWGSVTVCFDATPQLGLGLQRDVGEEAIRWVMHQIRGRLNLLLANFLDRRLPSSRFFAVCLVGDGKKIPSMLWLIQSRLCGCFLPVVSNLIQNWINNTAESGGGGRRHACKVYDPTNNLGIITNSVECRLQVKMGKTTLSR